MTKAPGRSLRPQKSMLILETRRPGEGRVLPGGASPPNRSIGLEKNSQKFLENSEFVWHGCGHGAVGGVFCDATNQELSPKPFRRTSPPSMDCKSQEAW
jgi:hypothetical protein